MADENTEPRRYKMPSEFTDDDRASTGRLGNGGRRPERDEYARWRERILRDERDDLRLRGRLLAEQADGLRAQADDQRRNAHDELTPDDHHAHLLATQTAREKGVEAPRLGDGGASKVEQQAEQLEAEAQEIHDHLSQEAAA